MCGSCRNSPLPPTLKFQSRTSGSPRPTSIPSKRPWSGRARWWADTGCWPRRSWKCWRPLHQSPPSPRWSSWWFPDTSIISPHVIIVQASVSYSLTTQVVCHGAHFVPMKAGSGWRKQTRLSTFHGHPTGKRRPRRGLVNMRRRKIRSEPAWMSANRVGFCPGY